MDQHPKTLTIEECDKLIATAEFHNYTKISKFKALRNTAMILCMLDAGLRVGEVAQMDITWFMYEEAITDKLTIPDYAAKNKEPRTIPIGARLHCALKLMSIYWYAASENQTIHYSFCNRPFGTCLSIRQIQRVVKNIGRRAIIGEIHPHMLRHTFGTRLMRKTNASIVQKLLGHKHLSSTQIYMHPDADDLKAAIDAIDGDNDKEKS